MWVCERGEGAEAEDMRGRRRRKVAEARLDLMEDWLSGAYTRELFGRGNIQNQQQLLGEVDAARRRREAAERATATKNPEELIHKKHPR
jgi:hypothetical protein